MAQAPIVTNKIATPASTPASTPAPTMSKLDMVLAALAASPAAKEDLVQQMVQQVAAKQGVDLSKMTTGKKAAFTRRIKEVLKRDGISLD